MQLSFVLYNTLVWPKVRRKGHLFVMPALWKRGKSHFIMVHSTELYSKSSLYVIVLLYALVTSEGHGRGPTLQIETTVAGLPNFESDRLNIKWPISHWMSVGRQRQRPPGAGHKYKRQMSCGRQEPLKWRQTNANRERQKLILMPG